VQRKLVAYYRVGDILDLEEQVKCVEDHSREVGGIVIKAYRDEETSRRPDRAELAKTLAYAKRNGASLIIATLKGLSRDVQFLRALQESGVDFAACDMPHANASTIHVLAALAEYDARMASDRSKRALAAYRDKGGKLGAARPEGRNLDAQARAKGARTAGMVVKAKADEAYRQIAPMMRELRKAGHTLQEIADRLNDEGFRTRRGHRWNAMQVSRVLMRFAGMRG
jgi:DNA invertase Pin-like site-specific DNA recombinase